MKACATGGSSHRSLMPAWNSPNALTSRIGLGSRSDWVMWTNVTWSFTDDVARMLVTAGTDPRAWGRAWHVPSNEPLSQRQVIGDFARAAGVGQVRVGEIPSVVLRGMGLVSPLLREVRETEYQFRDDFVMDSSAAQAAFGLKPAPWEGIVAETVRTR